MNLSSCVHNLDKIHILCSVLKYVITHGPLPWTVLFKKNYENLQNWIFLKTLLLRISQKVYKKYHAQKKS